MQIEVLSRMKALVLPVGSWMIVALKGVARCCAPKGTPNSPGKPTELCFPFVVTCGFHKAITYPIVTHDVATRFRCTEQLKLAGCATVWLFAVFPQSRQLLEPQIHCRLLSLERSLPVPRRVLIRVL